MTPTEPSFSPWREAVIERVERRTPRVVSLFLRTTIGPSMAGQHVDVRLTAPDGYQAQRSYSIASAPGAPVLELVVERLEDGEVSPYFADVAEPGDTIEVRGPLGGHFVWRASDGGPLLLVGGGSGVAPLLAIIRHRVAASPTVPALLAYSARAWDELIYRDDLLRLSADDPHFHLRFATTRDAPRRDGDLGRRFDRGALGALLRDLERSAGVPTRHAFVCGSTPFVEDVANALVDEGLAAERIRTERYGGTV